MTRRLALLLAFFCLPVALARAGIIPPSGLAPGSKYQLIFFTAATTTALSSDVEFYNAFVNLQAASGAARGYLPAGVNWHAVVSTDSVNANVNAPWGEYPVYNVRGDLVAPAGIYTGSLINPVRYDETGDAASEVNGFPWTGSDPFGNAVPGRTLGASSGRSMIGSDRLADMRWMTHDSFEVPQVNTWSIYALSDPITVPVPEPSTVALLGIGGLAVAVRRFFSRRKS